MRSCTLESVRGRHLRQQSSTLVQKGSKRGPFRGCKKSFFDAQISLVEVHVWIHKIISRGRINILKGAAPSPEWLEQVSKAYRTIEDAQKKMTISKLFLSKNVIFTVLKQGTPLEFSTDFQSTEDFFAENDAKLPHDTNCCSKPTLHIYYNLLGCVVVP